MHTTKIILAAGLFTVTALASAIAIGGPVTDFTGSRADVRSFCEGEGFHLIEGGNFSLCTTPTADVVCRDDNACSSSDLELAFAAGFQRVDVAVLSGPSL
jgi:hypothetical protein